jgi:hypothetical protein
MSLKPIPLTNPGKPVLAGTVRRASGLGKKERKGKKGERFGDIVFYTTA